MGHIGVSNVDTIHPADLRRRIRYSYGRVLLKIAKMPQDSVKHLQVPVKALQTEKAQKTESAIHGTKVTLRLPSNNTVRCDSQENDFCRIWDRGTIYQTGATDNGGNRGMYKVIVIDDETLVRQRNRDGDRLAGAGLYGRSGSRTMVSKDWKPCGNTIRIC